MFTSASSRSAYAYKRASVDASVDMASPHQLVNLLFEALNRHLGAAKFSMQSGDVVGKCKQIGAAMRILQEGLIAPLDLTNGGQLAGNLKNLYDYCVRQLMMANVRNEPELLDEIIRLIEPVASSWKQIGGQGPAYLKPV